MAKDPEWPALTFEMLPWDRDGTAPASRRAFRAAAGPYRAAIPAFIRDQPVDLTSEILALADDATSELTRFDAEVGTLAAPFSAILLRTESASSSEVEQITSSAKQVALAEIDEASSSNARLVVGNVHAMEAAIALADALDPDSVIEMHRALLEQHAPEITGRWRDQPVWIGGGSISPHNAEFVPPFEGRVPALMDDVMQFARRTDIPVLAQTAIAHAQFETIHPFPDGNGRVGRALVQGMLRAGRVTRSVAVPVSAGLLHDLPGYFAALTAYREGKPGPIIESFAEASFSAVRNGRRLVGDLQAARDRWDSIVEARSDSSVHRLKTYLLRQPVITARVAVAELGVSAVAVQTAIDRLVEAGVLEQTGGGRRNRRWAAPDVLAALDAFGARALRRAG
ncbi:MAG: Fic family protein [Herbiconiux sp.]|uniref:Fic family protein n=1 Tax=Herbiconiux sp. TaxID=1871186 RepID=UPI0011F5CD88|nr:Fic family protein [Herbiconiux sp.]TAJ48530.1 MAG: Fic family protein [Herbiconiux sp.]